MNLRQNVVSFNEKPEKEFEQWLSHSSKVWNAGRTPDKGLSFSRSKHWDSPFLSEITIIRECPMKGGRSLFRLIRFVSTLLRQADADRRLPHSEKPRELGYVPCTYWASPPSIFPWKPYKALPWVV